MDPIDWCGDIVSVFGLIKEMAMLWLAAVEYSWRNYSTQKPLSCARLKRRMSAQKAEGV